LSTGCDFASKVAFINDSLIPASVVCIYWAEGGDGAECTTKAQDSPFPPPRDKVLDPAPVGKNTWGQKHLGSQTGP
jgi:hypothetical protein